MEICEKKFIGTVSENSILNCTAGKFYLYKDSTDVSFIQDLGIQLLGKQQQLNFLNFHQETLVACSAPFFRLLTSIFPSIKKKFYNQSFQRVEVKKNMHLCSK